MERAVITQTEEQARSLGVELCSLDELLQTSQIISLHSNLTPSTIGSIGKRELSLIQDGALFVNTARAKIVEEEALMNELQAGLIFAALGVFHEEPVPAKHPLLALDHVLCVPHIGGFARTYKRCMGEFVVVTLEEFGRMTTIQMQ